MSAAHIIERDPIACEACRHRGILRDLAPDELRLVRAAKRGRFWTPKRGIIADAGTGAAILTLYSGFAARSVATGGEPAVIVELLLPGDHLAVSAAEIAAGARIVALTDASWCLFDPDAYDALYAHPGLARRLAEIERRRRTLAEARAAAFATLPASGLVCHFLLTVFDGLAARRLADRGGFVLPIGRTELARALGLSVVHLRRVLGGLAPEIGLTWAEDRVTIGDMAAARRLAGGIAPAARAAPLL